MVNYKHYCVIDSRKRFVTLVLVHDINGAQEIQGYTLKLGEALVDTNFPTMRPCAGAEGFINPTWDGFAWVESATADEISAWEKLHPAEDVPEPEVEPDVWDELADAYKEGVQSAYD